MTDTENTEVTEGLKETYTPSLEDVLAIKLLDKNMLVALFQLISPVQIDALRDDAPQQLQEKKLILSSILEALKVVHNIETKQVNGATQNGSVFG